MKKEFLISENGKIKECPSNISKMNVLFYIFTFNIFKRFLFYLVPEKSEIESFIVLFVRLIIFLTFPISIPFMVFFSSMLRIKKAKKEVELYNKRKK